LQHTQKSGADSPPLAVRTVRLRNQQPDTEEKLKGGQSAKLNRTVRRQSTENRQVLNQISNSIPNSKIDQMNSKSTQISGTELEHHHEGIPKRSSSKDQSFTIKITKFGLQMGFSPKERF
jgi:hypothetical protein